MEGSNFNRDAPEIDSLLEGLDEKTDRQLSINEEYKSWKKNAPYLYDMVITSSFDWPTLTCQWFPDIETPEGKDYSIQRMLLGTNTSGQEPEYVKITSILVPKEYDEEVDGSKEGDYGKTKPKFTVTHKINHLGEVNKARYMPQNPDIIATFSSTGQNFIFDRTRHPSNPPEDGICRPEIELTHHTEEGFGLDWSSENEGHLLTASGDKTICHWDISSWTKGQSKMNPITVYKGHSAYVEDVSWSVQNDKMFGSVGDDGKCNIWDIRKDGSTPALSFTAHNSNANCITFNPFSQTLFATASADKTVALWDFRNINSKVHSLVAHDEEVRSLEWSPTHSTLLASAGIDRRLIIWDVSKVGDVQTEEDALDGPPELMFLHGGHTSHISDISWNPVRPWCMATVAEDNVCQIWQMASNIINDEMDGGSSEEDDEEEDNDDMED